MAFHSDICHQIKWYIMRHCRYQYIHKRTQKCTSWLCLPIQRSRTCQTVAS